MGIQNVMVTKDSCLVVPQKIKCRIIKWSTDCTSQYTQKNENIWSNESFYIDTHSSIIHNNQIVEKTKWLLTNKCINKIWYSYSTKSCLVIKRNEVLIYAIVQSLSRVWPFAAPWTVARQAPLSFTNSRSFLRFMSIKSTMLSNHLILCHPLLWPSTFPSLRVFSNESALRIRRPKYWSFSFSIS